MMTLKILIIEEDIKIASIFNQIKNEKIKIKIVNNGIEAYKTLYDTTPYLQYNYVVTNIGLPDENGVEIIKFIKKKFTSKIIIYTHKHHDFYKDKCHYDFSFDKELHTPDDIINLIMKDFNQLSSF